LFIGLSVVVRGLSRVHELGQSARGTALPARQTQRARGRDGRRPGGGACPPPANAPEMLMKIWGMKRQEVYPALEGLKEIRAIEAYDARDVTEFAKKHNIDTAAALDHPDFAGGEGDLRTHRSHFSGHEEWVEKPIIKLIPELRSKRRQETLLERITWYSPTGQAHFPSEVFEVLNPRSEPKSE